MTPDARWRRGVEVGAGAGREACALRAPCRPAAGAAPVTWGVQAAEVAELVLVRGSVTPFSHVSQLRGRRVRAAVPARRVFLSRLAGRSIFKFPRERATT